MTTEYNILGASHATISVILETLHRIHPAGVRATIIQNTVVEDELPFDLPPVETTTMFHDGWDHREDASRQVPCLCGVYKPAVKQAVFDFFETHYRVGFAHYANLVHPTTNVALTVRLDAGVYVGPHTVMAPYTRLGNLVFVNRSVTIGHHTTIGDFCTLNPGVNVAGRCRIGRSVTIGMGANIVDDVTVGDSAVVGAGALVTRDVPPRVTVYGVPARVVGAVQ